jgi:integrase
VSTIAQRHDADAEGASALSRLPSPATTIVPGSVTFGDDVWDLTPLCPRPTTRWITLRFAHCPAPLREDVKHFFYLMLSVDTPLERLDRPASARRRLTPSTLKTLFEDLKPFLTWLGTNGRSSLAAVTDDDLHAYATEVAAAPIGQNPKTRRLFAASRLWLMAPYLRPESRLPQPFWERDGMEAIVGKSEWTAENKSAPVHPVTMSALLVWCLRIIEDAPHVLRALHTRAGSRHQGAGASASPAGGTPAPAVTGPWVGQITPASLAAARRVLTTACLVTVAYLTGMRSDEVLGLRRGCCTLVPTGSGTTAGYEIRGRTYKSAVADGRSIAAGVERAVPWKAIKPVADAIAIMEQLHEEDLLFSTSLFRATLVESDLDPGGPSSSRIRDSIEFLTTWCNQRSHDLGRSDDIIPDDPAGSISLRRLRRTLAWFIYRRPRGRVALGVQYGHLHAATTDGYGSRVSAGLRDLFPMEEAFAISDSLHAAAEHLDANPTVSGPAAQRYRAAVAEYRHRFEGMSLTPKQAGALMANSALRVYDADGQTLACCFDPRKALCRKETNGKTAQTSTPDLTSCDDKCANIARTNRHIEQLQADVTGLREELDSPLTPAPLRHRVQLQLTRHEELIRAHECADGGGP